MKINFTAIFEKIKNIFKCLDEKIIKIMKNGLKFSFSILIISTIILITYLFFVHNNLIYQIGILVFQISIYIGIDFIVSGIAVDSIKKQIF